MPSAPYTAPSTRAHHRAPEPGALLPAPLDLTRTTSETMSSNQPTDAELLATALADVALLRQQLDEARTPQRGSTPSENGR